MSLIPSSNRSVFTFHRKTMNLAWLVIVTLTLLQACQSGDIEPDPGIKRQIKIADSLYFAGNTRGGLALLAQIRAKVKSSDPSLSSYYCQRTMYFNGDGGPMNLYADSALAYFEYDDRKTKYPTEYFQALLTKGDACFKAKKYTQALRYYYRGKEVLPGGNCDNGNLASKIGGIYYDQGKYALAGRYWAESYQQLNFCGDQLNKQKLFYLKQGALNNAGFSYERAGILDSAEYYYLADLNHINTAITQKLLPARYTNGALQVVYDNLGGLNIKKGNLPVAEAYLNKSMAQPITMKDGVLIPPLLKLTQLYLKKGEYDKAGEALKKSRAYLDLYYKADPDSQLKWTERFAEYLYATGKPAGAYQHQKEYQRLKDSVDNSSSVLYRLDVDREMNTLQQEQSLAVLQQNNNVKQVYLEAISVIVLLTIAIILLVYRNLKRTKKSNSDTLIKNQQLQIAYAQLELLNTNYIRVMRVMAHDLRNPLSGITGIASVVLAEEENLSEENRHLLKLIENTSNSSLEMINELLESGITDDNIVVKESLDLQALLYDSVELLQFKANEKDQQITFYSDEQFIIANVNYEKMWRVFNNLIINAIKFSPEGGLIKVGIRNTGKQILISIADNGIGIPDKDKDLVFEMFSPAKKVGTQGEQPFGLGLSISKKIIEGHGGRIWFESNNDAGTIFYVELPIQSQPA